MEEKIYLFVEGDIAILFENRNGRMQNTRQQRSKQELLKQISFGLESFIFDEAEKKVFSSGQENYEQYRFISRMNKWIISFLFPKNLNKKNESYRQALQQFLKDVHAQKSDIPKKKVINITFYSQTASLVLLGKVVLIRKVLEVKDEVFYETYQKRREFERK